MIKINLALRKQSTAQASQESGGTSQTFVGTLTQFKAPSFGGGAELSEVPWKTVLFLVLFGFGANLWLEDFKKEQLYTLEQARLKLVEETAKARKELEKTKAYDEEKKAVDAQELLLKTQIAVIEKLVADRQSPPKFVLSLSTSVPADLWLNQVSVKGTEIAIQGQSKSLNLVSDFMKTLGENPFVTGVQLKGSTQDSESKNGLEITSFDLVARKR